MALIEWRYDIKGERDGDNSWIENAPPRECEIQQFKIQTEGDRLNVASEAFDGPDEAQIELDKVLDSWVRESFLDGLRIKFVLGAIAQHEMNGKTIHESLTIPVAINFSCKVSPLLRQLPDPPEVMKDTPDAQRMVLALKKFEDEKDNLCTHAYLIHTIIEDACNKNHYKLQDRYKISDNVMEDLSSKANRDHPLYSRKAWTNGEKLTDDDISWLRDFAPLVGRRFLEVEYGIDVDDLQLITKGSLKH